MTQEIDPPPPHLQEDKKVMEKISIMEKVKRIGARIGFHLTSLGTGLLMGGFASRILPDAAAGNMGFFSMLGLTYFSLLLIFPHYGNRSASVLGVIVAIAALFTGYWPAGLFLGALIVFAVNTIHRWVDHEPFLKGSIVSFVFLLVCMGTGVSTLLFAMPLWYQLLCGAVTAAGIWRPHAVVRFVDKVFDKVRQKLRKTRLAPLSKETQPSSPVSPFDGFLSMLSDIGRLKTYLPDEMREAVDVIETKSRAIIECMKDDPRDTSRGTQFLNRYLPMIQTSIDRFVWISTQNKASPELIQTETLTQQALVDMSHAFDEMHQRLLENNVNDLMVDLRVMDKLIRSEGYTPPRK